MNGGRRASSARGRTRAVAEPPPPGRRAGGGRASGGACCAWGVGRACADVCVEAGSAWDARMGLGRRRGRGRRGSWGAGFIGDGIVCQERDINYVLSGWSCIAVRAALTVVILLPYSWSGRAWSKERVGRCVEEACAVFGLSGRWTSMVWMWSRSVGADAIISRLYVRVGRSVGPVWGGEERDLCVGGCMRLRD